MPFVITRYILSLGFAVCLAACGQKTSSELQSELDTALQNKNVNKAQIIAKNLISAAQQDNDQHTVNQTRIILAQLAANSGAYKIATRQLETPLFSGRAPAEVWHLGIFLAVESKNHELLGKLLNAPNNPIDEKQLAIYKTWFSNQIQDSGGSTELHKNAVNTSPYFRLFSTYFYAASNNNSLDNYQRYQTLINAVPNFVEGQLYFGRYLYATGHYSEAFEYLSKYIENRPKDTGTKALLAILSVKLGDFDSAHRYIIAVTKSAPNSPVVYQINALIALEHEDFQQALTQSELSLSSGAEDVAMRLVAGISHYHLENYDRANKHLTLISDLLPKDHPANKLLIKVKLKLNQTELAEDLLSNVEDKSIEDALILKELQSLYLENGERLKSKLASAKLTNLALGSEDVKSALLQANLQGEKQRLQQQVVNSRFEDQELFKLITIYLYENQIDSADKLSLNWLDKRPNDINAINARAMVLSRLNKQSEAQQLLTKALSIDPFNRPSLFLKFKRFRANQQWSEMATDAEALLKQEQFLPESFVFLIEGKVNSQSLNVNTLSTLFNNKTPLYESIALEYLYQHQHFTLLMEYLAQKPNKQKSTNELVLSAAIALNTKQLQNAKTFALIILDREEKLTAAQTSLLVKLLATAGEPNVAERVLNLAETHQVNIDNANYMKAELFAAQNKYEQLRSMLSIEGTSEIERLNIQLLIDKSNKDIEASWKTANRILNVAPSYEILKFVAQIGLGSNRKAQVKHIVLKNIDRLDDQKTARKQISTWFAEDDPDFTLAILEVASMRQIIDADYVLLNNLAWLHHHKGNSDKARSYIDKARNIAPNNQDVKNTYNLVYQ